VSQPPGFEEQLTRVLRRHIEGFEALVSTERLSAGASQETYRLVIRDAAGERRLAMRRAPGGLKSKRAPGHPGMGTGTEALLMRTARQAGVPEPEVYAVLEPADELGEGFVMEWLDGETLGARIVRLEALAGVRARLAYQCGEILARIHAIDLAPTGLDRLLESRAPVALVEQTWEHYKEFNTPQPMIDYTARWLREHLPENTAQTLVHNDFRNGNLMVTQQGIVAVLDWEIAYIGDPMRDLGWLCTNSWRFGRSDLPVGGFGRYEDLFGGYEAVSGKKVDPGHVKFWEVYGSFWWAVGCLDFAEQYRTGPDKTVERLAIGRRSSECQVDCANLVIPGQATLIEPKSLDSDLDMPRTDELVRSVRDYLLGDVMAATEGRLKFMARVASNSLDIVLRELSLGQAHRNLEHERLCALLGANEDLQTLRWRLVHALRDGGMALDTPGLAEHLRQTVANQVAIDQPGYSGLRTALGARSVNPGRDS
jgi:aminoglycoside phosphotransferase (APT) family kinase protein